MNGQDISQFTGPKKVKQYMDFSYLPIYPSSNFQDMFIYQSIYLSINPSNYLYVHLFPQVESMDSLVCMARSEAKLVPSLTQMAKGNIMLNICITIFLF